MTFEDEATDGEKANHRQHTQCAKHDVRSDIIPVNLFHKSVPLSLDGTILPHEHQNVNIFLEKN